ncbi:MAG: exodeoxyribonuclease V subunit beta [Piscirickettsiaceae bacterium]|nr:exodeoxyribonuclease V subunit beta [Piscirickettsiaceae bacterium]
MTVFDVNTVALEGLNLIEASAGTGKTYTLAELYLRLILEQDLTVDQILVVTYTRAATEELRERLRQKLVDARDQRLSQIAPKQHELKKLNLAIQSFDEAAIFTIHGFCQRVLGDYAFESGLRFELELIGDDGELLQSVADDFWRKEVTTADKDFVAYLLSKKESSETLLKSVRSVIAKPYLNCLPVAEVNVEQLVQQIQTQFERVQKLWQTEQDDVIATLHNKALLNGNKYRTNSVEKWLVNLANLLSQPEIKQGLFDGFERFTPAKLEDALKKDQVLPPLLFWTACELLLEQNQQLQQGRELQRQALRLKLLEYCREVVPQQKQQQKILSYDDLLLNLEQAFKGSQGDWLVERLQEQYQAALIDEFQDTDPIQYASFSRLFSNSDLITFLVGDPKQAIYSFRGADIFTYLQAKSEAKLKHTLSTNWRSHPHLVSAVNRVFNRHSEPFIYKDIPFQAVDAARESHEILQLAKGDSTPLQILWADSDKSMSKKDLTAIAANVTADEIAKLLNLAQTGQAGLLDEQSQQLQPLTGGDIAVLVRNHRQAHAIQSCLQSRGINSVQQGRENVFDSLEAQVLERVLLAIEEPNNEARISAALTTGLWGLSAIELYQLQQDESLWLKQLNFFHDLHQLWLKHGFMRLFRQLLVTTSTSQSVQQRLLSLPDGERQLTNLLHLAELIQDHCSQQGEGIETVLHWLSSHRQSANDNDDTAQLRLESDEQLVKIITIHKSKGLEYPIVFCPFLWDANLRAAENKVISFHQDDADNTASVAFSEPALSQAAVSVTIEEQAEDLRLLYVALTRARERCVLIWADVKNIGQSALFSLLHSGLDKADSTLMLEDLNQLAQASNNTISVEPLSVGDMTHYLGASGQTKTLVAKEFKGTIQQPWRIGSFSALTRGHDAELPDYDAGESIVVAPVAQTNKMDRFGFARGAQAGTCLHAIYELWDFTSQDEDALQTLVSRTLLQYGFGDKWVTVVVQWVKEVVATPLNKSGIALSVLTPATRLDELAFYFPVANLSVNNLQKELLPLLAADSTLATVIKRLSFSSLTGFMKGFIDLVFEHEGKFYVVDYKSNHLGNTEADYQTEQLDDAMVAHDYPLQYLIYSLALHRYLKLRLIDYDPEIHLGGVYYLFIRGMKSEWGQAGIFYDKLDIALLEKFDACLQYNDGAEL